MQNKWNNIKPEKVSTLNLDQLVQTDSKMASEDYSRFSKPKCSVSLRKTKIITNTMRNIQCAKIFRVPEVFNKFSFTYSFPVTFPVYCFTNKNKRLPKNIFSYKIWLFYVCITLISSRLMLYKEVQTWKYACKTKSKTSDFSSQIYLLLEKKQSITQEKFPTVFQFGMEII